MFGHANPSQRNTCKNNEKTGLKAESESQRAHYPLLQQLVCPMSKKKKLKELEKLVKMTKGYAGKHDG